MFKLLALALLHVAAAGKYDFKILTPSDNYDAIKIMPAGFGKHVEEDGLHRALQKFDFIITGDDDYINWSLGKGSKIKKVNYSDGNGSYSEICSKKECHGSLGAVAEGYDCDGNACLEIVIEYDDDINLFCPYANQKMIGIGTCGCSNPVFGSCNTAFFWYGPGYRVDETDNCGTQGDAMWALFYTLKCFDAYPDPFNPGSP